MRSLETASSANYFLPLFAFVNIDNLCALGPRKRILDRASKPFLITGDRDA